MTSDTPPRSEYLLEFLANLERLPGVYLGISEPGLSHLAAYAAGYDHGLAQAVGDPDGTLILVPEDFQDFVARRLAPSKRSHACGWSGVIRSAVDSDRDGFALFIRLRREHEIERLAAEGGDATRPER